MSRRRKQTDYSLLLLPIALLVISRYKKKKRKEIVVPVDEAIDRPEYTTICLGEKELEAVKRAISSGNQYTWKNVLEIERLGKCDPRTGETDRNSNCYGYKVYYDDRTSRLISIASKYVEED